MLQVLGLQHWCLTVNSVKIFRTLFYGRPSGDCLFLVHISGFQLVFMIKNFGWYFSSILYRNEKWPLEGVHLIKIPWKLSLKKVIRNSVEEFQPTSLLKKTLSHTFACIKPSFLRDASRDFFLRTLCKSELNHVIRVVKLVGNSPGSSSLRDIVKLFLINFQIMDRKIGTNFLGP